MTDESGQSYPFTTDALLDKAIGRRGLLRRVHREHAHRQRGHRARTRSSRPPCAGSSGGLRRPDARMDRRPQRLVVRLVSLDRHELSFTVDVGAGRTACRAMVPTSSAVGELTGVTRNGTPISTTTETIKGVEYAFFNATPGDYVATYAVDDTAPAISNVSAIAGDGRHGHHHLGHRRAVRLASRLRHEPWLADSNESSAAMVTSHSVELTGLRRTRRITIGSHRSMRRRTPPRTRVGHALSFATPSASLTDTTVADFSAGTTGPDTYVSRPLTARSSWRPPSAPSSPARPSRPAGPARRGSPKGAGPAARSPCRAAACTSTARWPAPTPRSAPAARSRPWPPSARRPSSTSR